MVEYQCDTAKIINVTWPDIEKLISDTCIDFKKKFGMYSLQKLYSSWSILINKPLTPSNSPIELAVKMGMIKAHLELIESFETKLRTKD